MKIKWLEQKNKLCEIYSFGLQYSLFSKDNVQCCQWVLCKDFIHDIIWSQLNNIPIDIYSLKYIPNKSPKIDLDKTRILITNSSDEEFSKKIPASLDFMRQIERALHLKRTKAELVDNPEEKYKKCGIIAFTSSDRWLMAPPFLSLLLLFYRISFCHKIGDDWKTTINQLIKQKVKPYQLYDHTYLEHAKPVIDNMLKIGYRPFFFGEINKNYPKNQTVLTIHNNGGIVSLSNGATKPIVPHWSRKQLQQRLDGTFKPKEPAEMDLEKNMQKKYLDILKKHAINTE